MSRSPRSVLAISGLDPCGGAGLLADVGVFRMLRCQPLGVATCLTAQSLRTFRAVHPVRVEVLEEQLDVLLASETLAAVKIGLVPTAEIARALVERLRRIDPQVPIVIDPVLASSQDGFAADGELVAVLREVLLRRCTVITPNLPELARIAGPGPAEERAAFLLGETTRAVLVKGGHATGAHEVEDLLVTGQRRERIRTERLAGPKVHGTGCVLSAAIAGLLALGRSLEVAVRDAHGLLARLRRDATPPVSPGEMARLPLFPP